jgi:alkaline phosphatase
MEARPLDALNNIRNQRVIVELKNGKQFVGKLKAFDIHINTVLEEAEERGWATGFVVTSSIVHATPAAFSSHYILRSFHERIAADLLKVDIDFFVGGGERYFYDRACDDRNLLKELKKKSYHITRQIPSTKDASKFEKIACFSNEYEIETSTVHA